MYNASVRYLNPLRYEASADGGIVTIDLSKEPGAGTTTPLPLLLASLASCVAVYLERYLTGAKIAFTGFTIDAKSALATDGAASLRDIEVSLSIKGASLDDRRRKALIDFIRNCPVHNTLEGRPSISMAVV